MNDGEFDLTVINSNPHDPTEESFNAWTSSDQFPRAGKLRSAEDYCYQMIARDSHGNHYECYYVELRKGFEPLAKKPLLTIPTLFIFLVPRMTLLC